MNSETIFTVKNECLNLLDQDTAVEFFGKLLRAEALRLGPGTCQINVPRKPNVSDGGIDATVDANLAVAQSAIIASGKNGYQIKSGRTFAPWQEAVIKEELFGRGNPPDKENLGPGIQACIDAGGTYVLVCTGLELVDSQHRDVLEHIENFLKQCGYSHPKVEVWSQNTLIGFLQTFPSLALWVNKRGRLHFQTHQSWAEDANRRVPYVSGKLQDDLIAKIQNELRRNDEAIHVRILGESGVGKTRLVLEATGVKDLSPLVIYCEASQFRDSDLMNQILRDDNHFSVVLVIDECDSRDRSHIWNKLKHRGSRIKLITICNDYEEETSDLTPDITPLLEEEKICDILIQEYQVSETSVRRWAEICGGLPGVAHVIGVNLRDHQENLLTPPSTVNIWERCIAGNVDPKGQEMAQRWQVLRHIALFRQFGFRNAVFEETKIIAKKVEDEIPRKKFRKIVLDLEKRGILKGKSTLHITPKALHIKLWTEWWEDYYDEEFDLVEFTKDFTPELLRWFCGMFKYAAESGGALEIVKDLLGPNGPFQAKDPLLINLGSDLFLVLVEADPESALECLKQTIGKCDRETLLRFTWRRDVVWALEKIAVWQELFLDAARLLLKLGEAENETWSNNASGVFAELFSPAYDVLAPTQVPPVERLPILQEAFESPSKPRRLLALEACKVGLQPMDRWRRAIGAKYQGLRKEPEFWRPETYGELWAVYEQVWQLLFEQLDRLPEIDEQKIGVGILLENANQLVKHTNLSNMVADTIQMLSEKAYVDNRLLIKTVVEFLHHEGSDLSDDIKQRWEHLKDELIGSDFHSLMRRYVGTNLLVDAFDENENYFEEGHPQIHTLAQQAVEAPDLLQSELQWLVTAEAHNGYAFGYQLGKKDDGFVILPTLLEAQWNAGENASAFFLGGYFRVLFESNVTEWEKQLDALVEDTKLNVLIPDLTYHSGMTDQAGLRLLKLAKAEVMSVNNFVLFFVRASENLSGKVFTEWITFLLNCSNELAVPIALKLYYFYYVHGKQEVTLPRDLTFQLLVRPARFENLLPNQMNSMTGRYWTEIANAFLNLYPEKDLEFVERVIPHFGKKGTIFGTFNTKAFSVLTELAKRHPEQVWKYVSKRLEERDFFLEKWLKEGDSRDSFSTGEEKGALTFIPREEIWEWVDEDVENRAWYFAYRLVSKTLSAEEWQNSLARAFLVRYGQREDVRRNLRANYSTESWTGERSLHLESKKDKLLRINADEDNVNVKQWLNEFIDDLTEDIEHARIEEEREL